AGQKIIGNEMALQRRLELDSDLQGPPTTAAEQRLQRRALRRQERAVSEDEWNASQPVVVNLAGGESVSLRMNEAGAILAVEAAPSFQDLPQPCLEGLVDALPEQNGWDVLKGLQHLNRRTRKRLWSSDKWIVHLFAGTREKRELFHLEAHGYTILELDIERGKTHDILRPATWRVLEYAARKGKISAVIGGPPQGSFMIFRYNLGGPPQLRTNEFPYGNWDGQLEADVREVNKQTQLIARMIYLHALATAGRLANPRDPTYPREVGFLLEHPRDPRGYLKYGDPLYPGVVSLWRMPLWTEYALEAGEVTYLTGPIAQYVCKRVEQAVVTPVLSILRHLFYPQIYQDGRGTWVDYDKGELSEEDYKDEDDGLASDPADQVEKEGIKPKESVPDKGEAEEEDDEDTHKKLDPEEDIDLAPPELVNLIFATGIRDDKAATVLEAIQDVVLYCYALNVPVLRFHSDRGMEFQARATKQWLKSQGIRVTTSEAGVHQTNGAAESTVRWIKQRARKDSWKGPSWMTWLQSGYMVQEEDSGRFIHTLHVRAGLHDPGPVEADVDAEEPAGPSRRVRGKSAGSGDVVTLSKAAILDETEYKKRAEQLMMTWSQEEAKVLVKEVCQQLPASETVYGMFRYGRKAGVTRATLERPWFTTVLLKLLKDKVPDAEFASIYVSINSQREVHIDRNNAMGTVNYILPLIMPRRGGEIWQELRDGDVVSGRVTELTSQDGKARYGCAYPLQAGEIFCLNPHRRHAVLPSSGDRLVLVGYTPGMLQNLQCTDRALLWNLGFPMPLRDEEEGGDVRINMLNVRDLQGRSEDKGIIEEDDGNVQDPVGRDAAMEAVSTISSAASESRSGIPSEEWLRWELYLNLENVDSGAALVGTDSWDEVVLRNAEVGFTENVEELLNGLDSPLSIVHTVNPKEVVQYFGEWIPSLNKEIASLEHAVEKVHSSDQRVRKDIETGQGQVIPMKVVFTVKPPDMPADGSAPERWYKRKSRIVICGNLASHQPGEVYTNTAPAEVVRAAIAIARMFNWDLGMIDVVAAFLQTPLKGLKGAPLVYGIPPKLLVKAGLCKPGELWKLTHAVYGLQESPKLWGMYRDIRLAQIQLVFEGKKVVLMQGRVEPSWLSIFQEGSQLIGILVVYVDDILLCGRPELIKEIAVAIRKVWKTSELQLVSEGAIRFLGIEISMCTQGFALTQKSYTCILFALLNLCSLVEKLKCVYVCGCGLSGRFCVSLHVSGLNCFELG
ncbi:GIP, partial [Symbiodinium sp. CCMP2456]